MHTVRANDFTLPHRYISLHTGVGGVGFTWPRWVCTAEQGMIFRILSPSNGNRTEWSPISE